MAGTETLVTNDNARPVIITCKIYK